ncbi:MAG: hypothetical protein ABIS26_02490 [Candidatus Paceibacterota bacterium]
MTPDKHNENKINKPKPKEVVSGQPLGVAKLEADIKKSTEQLEKLKQEISTLITEIEKNARVLQIMAPEYKGSAEESLRNKQALLLSVVSRADKVKTYIETANQMLMNLRLEIHNNSLLIFSNNLKGKKFLLPEDSDESAEIPIIDEENLS